MHDKVYDRLSTESNIGSRKICMDELVFLNVLCPLPHSLQSRRILERDPWIVFWNDVVPPSWTLILPESWDESKSVFKGEVEPSTPLPPPALEMDTQDAGVTLILSVAKLKRLKFDARSLYFERALYFAKLDLVSREVFVRILTHSVKL